jgi:hypothetical protein
MTKRPIYYIINLLITLETGISHIFSNIIKTGEELKRGLPVGRTECGGNNCSPVGLEFYRKKVIQFGLISYNNYLSIHSTSTSGEFVYSLLCVMAKLETTNCGMKQPK